jgi:hypothetical protein
MSTVVDRDFQHVLYRSRMNMGRRIQQMLDELNMSQSDLIDRVPDLSPQSLSAMIKRDTKTSEHAPEISTALGVQLLWLLTGRGEKLDRRVVETSVHTPVGAIGEPPGPYALTTDERAVVDLYRQMCQTQKDIYRQIGQVIEASKPKDLATESD